MLKVMAPAVSSCLVMGLSVLLTPAHLPVGSLVSVLLVPCLLQLRLGFLSEVHGHGGLFAITVKPGHGTLPLLATVICLLSLVNMRQVAGCVMQDSPCKML